MARSTYQCFLMIKRGGSGYEKLVDIKSFPDLGGPPEMLETTTLSNRMQTFVPGIQQLDSMEFTANYDVETYTEILALENQEHDYSVWMGGDEDEAPLGDDGKYDFKGKLSVYVTGGGVNEVVNMNITIAPSTSIKLNTAP